LTRELTMDSKTGNKNFTAEMLEVINIMNKHKHKAIILYLIPENEPPPDRN